MPDNRVTSFNLSDDLYKRVNFAAAGLGMSSAEYIRRALVATMTADAMNDPTLSAAFAAMDAAARDVPELQTA